MVTWFLSLVWEEAELSLFVLMTSGSVDVVGGQGMQTVVVLGFVVFLFCMCYLI